MKKQAAFLAIVVLAFFAAGTAKNALVRIALEHGIRFVTGLDLKMDRLDVDILSQSVRAQDLRLLNPKGYPEDVMMQFPEIHMRSDIPSLLRKNIHLPELFLDLGELSVIKTSEGRTNVNDLRTLGRRDEKAPELDQTEQKAEKQMSFKVDRLHLKIGRVTFKDYSRGGKPFIRSVNLNMDEEFYDITSAKKLVALVVFKALYGSSLGGLLDVNLKALQGAAAGTLSLAKTTTSEAETLTASSIEGASRLAAETLAGTSQKFLEPAIGIGKKAGAAAGQTTESARRFAGKVADQIDRPFRRE